MRSPAGTAALLSLPPRLIDRPNRAVMTAKPIFMRRMTMNIPVNSKRTPPPPNRERLVFD